MNRDERVARWKTGRVSIFGSIPEMVSDGKKTVVLDLKIACFDLKTVNFDRNIVFKKKLFQTKISSILVKTKN